MSELNIQNINIYKCFDKIIRKFVAKLFKYRILTFLGLDYRDASLIILYLIVIGNSTPKIRLIGWLYHIKFVVKIVKNQPILT